MKEKFDIIGMRCSGCSARVQKNIDNLEGIIKADVNLLSNSMVAEYDEKIVSKETIIKTIKDLGFDANVHTDFVNEAVKKDAKKRKISLIVSICLLIPLMFFSMSHMFGIVINTIVLLIIESVLTLSIIIINFFYFKNGYKALFKKSPNMDSLIALGATASIIYSIYLIIFTKDYINNLFFDSAAMILTFVSIGKYIEALSKSKTSDAITKLINLSPSNSFIFKDGREQLIKTKDIKVGDIVVIKAGFNVSVDGTVIEGEGFTDEAPLTGESKPIEKSINDQVYCGTTLLSGYIKVRADKEFEDTKLASIVKLVEEASSSKAPISRLADKVSLIFVPTILLIGLIVFAIWGFIVKDFNLAVNFGICVLVISCPCALGLATPTAIMVGTGKAAELGILIKSSESLELLSKTKNVILDKTGTITEGKMSISHIDNINIKKDELINIASSLESKSDHPIKNAFTSYSENINLYDVESFESFSGKGICGIINNKKYYLGSRKYITSIINSIPINESNNVNLTSIYLSNDKELLGIIYLQDKIRETSIEAINKLNAMGIDTYLLTGDNKETALYIQRETNIKEVKYELLPNDKEQVVRLLSSVDTTVMVGDGINDSPALISSSVGVAIGEGTDIAIDSADVILERNDLNDLVTAIELSKKVLKNIKENLFWAFIYNAIAIPLAAGALYYPLNIKLTPIIGTIAMSLSSICVVLNALRIKLFKK